jgi:hypothetical protein
VRAIIKKRREHE